MLNEWPHHRDREVRTRGIADLVCDLTCTWKVDREGSLIPESVSRRQFLGYDAHELMEQQSWVPLLHPDDRTVVEDALAQVYANQDATLEIRVRSASGAWHWLRVFARPDWSPALQRVVRLHGGFQDITTYKRREIEKTALLEVARDIAGMLDLEAMLSRVHRRVAQVLPCDVVATFRWEESSNAFRAVAEHGVPAELRQDMMQLRMARGTFGGRTRRGQPVVINDVTEQSWLSPELCARFRIAALIAVPLLVRNRHFGTLVAYSMVPNRFDDGQVELCEAIAHQLAVALEGAELYVAQQEQAAVAGALARVAQELIASLDRPTSMERFCELVTEVLDCEVAQTWLWNASEQMYLPAAAHGYTREEWEQLRTLRLPLEVVEQAMGGGAEVSEVRAGESTDNDSRPTLLCFGESVQLCMRLHLGDETIGIQCAGYRRSQPISPTQRRIARGIGQVASMALSHARLVDELARANRLKSDFVATMSHELRTPLNTLMGYTDLLAAGEFGPVNGEQRNVLERMDHSARELLDLINATLDLSRIEARRLPIEVREVEMPELLRELDHETRYQRQRRGLELLWEVSEDSVRICSDRVKLKVILKNLLSNALKFTERGAVRIHVHSQNSGIEISVQDSGVGIQPDILPIIFEPFRQGERAATRRFGGVGLGLYVVRRLLDLLEGSITVESEPGRGSTFRVWLPSLSATAAIE